MDELIRKADVLIEALPYIQRFRGETIVVKFGGSAMEEKKYSDGILADVTFMECVGMLPVVVHGGGKVISRNMKEQGIESMFVQGLRVTCEKSIAVVEKVIKEEVNAGIVKTLGQMGARAQGVHGETVFSVMKKTGQHPETGETLDWGFVGEPVSVETGEVRDLLQRGIIPVVTPLGLGPDGKVYNINADIAAAALAAGLKARKLAFLSDVPGLLRDKDDAGSLISTLREAAVEDLVKRKVIDGGMLPKIESGLKALDAGVMKIHIIDGRAPHSLLLEIFTDKGIGTEIVK
ncbi:MAG: acetylglutamate kinase [Lentisphaerales bacterium]|jgi:acetylglutamate kinase|nr:MAG: acetylglutamate kinase [Lentisphaerales bacterium]